MNENFPFCYISIDGWQLSYVVINVNNVYFQGLVLLSETVALDISNNKSKLGFLDFRFFSFPSKRL